MIERSELHDAAQKAFPADQLCPDRDASWKLAAEMGWLMMPLPEDAGGLGLGRDAVCAIHFELGKVLARLPLAAALVAVGAVGTADALPDREGWTERLTTGEFVTTSLALDAAELDAGGTLSGTLRAVADADMAGHVLVFAPALCALVPLGGAGVTVTERPLWDESRRLFDVRLAGHAVDPAFVLARGAAAESLAEHARSDLQLALAADALGGAQAALDMTVEYLKTRKQFERPLAMFQALKHRCADLKTRIGAAEALLWARAADGEASAAQIGALKALAGEVFRFVTQEAIQLHGGIGLTGEHNCHLFMKRAMLNLWLGGGADACNEAAGKAALALLA